MTFESQLVAIGDDCFIRLEEVVSVTKIGPLYTAGDAPGHNTGQTYAKITFKTTKPMHTKAPFDEVVAAIQAHIDEENANRTVLIMRLTEALAVVLGKVTPPAPAATP